MGVLSWIKRRAGLAPDVNPGPFGVDGRIRGIRAFCTLMAVAAVLALLAGCAVQSTRHDDKFENAPEPVRQDWQLTKQRCSGCHELDRVFLKLYMYEDRGDIEWLVSDMAGRSGSGITEDDAHRITDTLNWYREHQ